MLLSTGEHLSAVGAGFCSCPHQLLLGPGVVEGKALNENLASPAQKCVL